MMRHFFRAFVSRRSWKCVLTLLVLSGILSAEIGLGLWKYAAQTKDASSLTEDLGLDQTLSTSSQAKDVNVEKILPSDVILVTYMRSGSTFLGQMLGHRNDSFYWYEPLWVGNVWTFYREDGNVCNYAKPECQQEAKKSTKSLEDSLQFLRDIYNCSLRNHAGRLISQMHSAPWAAGPSWEEYRKCKGPVQQCMTRLEPVCQHKTHRVTKVLRLDFALTATLLRHHPWLKAVLLLRDPRGTLNSHIQSKEFPLNANIPSVIKASAGVFCSRITRDINAAKNLSNLFKDRVKVVQYEDFEDPRKLDYLYEFLGMEIPKTRMKKELQEGHGFFNYRKSLPWHVVKTMDEECTDVYQELGLVAYRDEKHLRNVTQSALEKALSYALRKHG